MLNQEQNKKPLPMVKISEMSRARYYEMLIFVPRIVIQMHQSRIQSTSKKIDMNIEFLYIRLVLKDMELMVQGLLLCNHMIKRLDHMRKNDMVPESTSSLLLMLPLLKLLLVQCNFIIFLN